MRNALILTLAILLALPSLLAAVLLQPDPLVAQRLEASPEKALATRELVRRVRGLTENPTDDPILRVSLDEANAALAFGARLVPWLRGQVDVVDGAARLRVSAPALAGTPFAWANLEARAEPFDGPPRLTEIRLGPLSLPPDLTLRAGVLAANLALGGRAGDRMRDAVQGLALAPAGDAVLARVVMDGDERSSLTRRVTNAVRGSDMPGSDVIAAHYVALREAIDDGRLPDRGDFTPYLRFIVAQTLTRAAPGEEADHFTAALFALTMTCGARDFRLVVGRLLDGAEPQDDRTWTRHCLNVTFGDRVDLKRHFITAAAIKAATTRSVSFRIGEFKELVDSITGAGGFDFTDVVANNSGIRFAQTFMAAPRADWPRLGARIGAEADVLAPRDGIPGLLPRPDFDARFGKVDSPAYLAMIAEIESRIDRLPLHAPLDPS